MDPLLQQSGDAASAEESRKRAAPDGEEDGSQQQLQHQQQRSKRNRYVSIACNECKRRKIRCNGQTPCERCGNLQLECVYAPNWGNSYLKDATEFKHLSTQVYQLQGQVDYLWQSLNSLRCALGQEPLPPMMQTDTYDQQQTASLAASASQAQAQVQAQSQANMVDPALSNAAPDRRQYAQAQQNPNSYTQNNGKPDDSTEPWSDVANMHPHKDPIWSFKKEEALRLCSVFEEQLQPLYPIIDLARVSQHAKYLFDFIGAAYRTGLMLTHMPGADALNDAETEILKMVLAIAMVCDQGGASALSNSLSDNVFQGNNERMRGSISLNFIRIVLLQSIYHYQKDDIKTASRTIALAARLCLEFGLNKPEGYALSDMNEADEARNIFWMTYILDHRFQGSVGMSFALPDIDIDPTLDSTEFRTMSPYLGAMVTLTRLGVELSQLVSATHRGFDPTHRVGRLSFSEIERDIANIDDVIPEYLKYTRNDEPGWKDFNPSRTPDHNAKNVSVGLYRAKISLYMRSRALRLAWARHILCITTTAGPDADFSVVATAIKSMLLEACQTMKTLHQLQQNDALDKTNQVLFLHFLPAAVGTSLLPTIMYPDYFKEPCTGTVQTAADLIAALHASAHPDTIQRVTRMLRGLRAFVQAQSKSSSPTSASASAISSRLASAKPTNAQAQAQVQDAAMAMAGLAGHSVDESAFSASVKPGGGARRTGAAPPEISVHLDRLLDGLGGGDDSSASSGSKEGASEEIVGLSSIGMAMGDLY